MLIHGRLSLTHNGFMLDEVRSLLQKALRRQSPLTFQATKELIGHGKDQLPWKSIVTFIFEDHCVNNVEFFNALFKLYEQKQKYECIELIQRSYTCRYAACLQVVALNDDYCHERDYFRTDLPPVPALLGLVQKESGKIDIDLVLANIVKHWQGNNTKALARLFVAINMADKVEKRQLTKAGVQYLVFLDTKRPTLYHLVLSVLYKHTVDEYMKGIIHVFLKFVDIADVPKGLIMFAVLTNLIHKDAAMKAKVDCTNLGDLDWIEVCKLDKMPSWAVDKHTFRGKFGKESKHLFLKKVKNAPPLTETEIEEFHGPRPKCDIKVFFETGCTCFNEILPNNPIWEDTKNMYFKQKPSQQKTAKMTQTLYSELREVKSVFFGKTNSKCSITDNKQSNRKRKVENTNEKSVSSKRPRVEAGTSKEVNITDGSVDAPDGPLLQLPTGSAKVYTRLDTSTGKVWKGPYKSTEKLNLCMFYHKAMVDIFMDKHTLPYEQKGKYLIFPLVQLNEGEKPKTKFQSFYDCIGKKEVKMENGEFVERSSLGITQLHKLEPNILDQLPVSIWAHFAFRYILNIGDSGLYNAIVTTDLRDLFGIDMEENRNQVKGNSVLELIFVKQPNKKLRDAIESRLLRGVEDFAGLVCRDFDLYQLRGLYRRFGVRDETDRCKRRLVDLQSALDKMCKRDLGV